MANGEKPETTKGKISKLFWDSAKGLFAAGFLLLVALATHLLFLRDMYDGALKASVDATARANQLTGEVEGTKKNIETLKKNMESGEATLSQQLRELELRTKKLDDINGKLAELERKQSTASASLQEQDKKVAEYNKKVSEYALLIEQSEKQAKKLSDLLRENGEVAELVMLLKAEAKKENSALNLGKRVEAMDSKLKDVDSTLASYRKLPNIVALGITETMTGKVGERRQFDRPSWGIDQDSYILDAQDGSHISFSLKKSDFVGGNYEYLVVGNFSFGGNPGSFSAKIFHDEKRVQLSGSTLNTIDSSGALRHISLPGKFVFLVYRFPRDE